ncbi:MAG TPA: hypothetical protein VE131_16770 [Terriglobales bacterium]|nr:hypothetical protein [Terriglobales bacterium]
MELILGLWWFFLVAAVIITLVDVYLLSKVIRLCRQVRVLTSLTLPAAGGIARNTDAAQELGRTVELAGGLAQKTREIERVVGPVVNQLLQEEP